MSSKDRSREDFYESIHFSFNSTEFCEDFAEMVNSQIKSTLNDLQNLLIDKIHQEEDVLANHISQLYELYSEKMKTPMCEFQTVARAIFALPLDKLNPESKNETEVSDEQLKLIEKEFKDLKKEYLEEVYYRSLLKKEDQKWDQIKPLYDKAEEILKFRERRKSDKSGQQLRELFQSFKAHEEAYLRRRLQNGQPFLVDRCKLFKKKTS